MNEKEKEYWTRLFHLAMVLIRIKENDQKYDKRNKLVYRAMGLATELGYEVGVRYDQEDQIWPVVYIDLPTGQVSWDVPQYPKPWDRHSTEEKYERVDEFFRQVVELKSVQTPEGKFKEKRK